MATEVNAAPALAAPAGRGVIHLHQTLRGSEQAGFEVLEVENLRPHYARTGRLWEQRLAAERERRCSWWTKRRSARGAASRGRIGRASIGIGARIELSPSLPEAAEEPPATRPPAPPGVESMEV